MLVSKINTYNLYALKSVFSVENIQNADYRGVSVATVGLSIGYVRLFGPWGVRGATPDLVNVLVDPRGVLVATVGLSISYVRLFGPGGVSTLPRTW